MNIDWIIALSMFLVVVAWSFSFYSGFFTEKSQPLSDVLNSISDKFVNYLVIGAKHLPIKKAPMSQTKKLR